MSSPSHAHEDKRPNRVALVPSVTTHRPRPEFADHQIQANTKLGTLTNLPLGASFGLSQSAQAASSIQLANSLSTCNNNNGRNELSRANSAFATPMSRDAATPDVNHKHQQLTGEHAGATEDMSSHFAAHADNRAKDSLPLGTRSKSAPQTQNNSKLGTLAELPLGASFGLTQSKSRSIQASSLLTCNNNNGRNEVSRANSAFESMMIDAATAHDHNHHEHPNGKSNAVDASTTSDLCRLTPFAKPASQPQRRAVWPPLHDEVPASALATFPSLLPSLGREVAVHKSKDESDDQWERVDSAFDV